MDKEICEEGLKRRIGIEILYPSNRLSRGAVASVVKMDQRTTGKNHYRLKYI